MKLDNVFKKTKTINDGCPAPQGKHPDGNGKKEAAGDSPRVPEGFLRRCNHCREAFIAEEAIRGGYICPKCGGYFRVPAFYRLEMILDPGTFREWDAESGITNPMGYRGYEEKIRSLREKTGLREAVVTGYGQIGGRGAAVAVCDGRFLMASMGSVVGEKITRAVERATAEKLPVIMFACSGGARMQEGITSLMQMAKTSAALKRHSDAGLLYVSVLTDPTTGGVTASFAMLGDIILSEPGALIGFAGPRVIEQTIGQKLPKGFQRAEFLLKHGFIDAVVKREDMRSTLALILKLHDKDTGTDAAGSRVPDGRISEDHPSLPSSPAGRDGITAWDRVAASRKKDRPVSTDYLKLLFEDLTELHGDRCFGDDSAVIGGIGSFGGRPVTVLAQAKGKDTKDNIERNFGMPSPEGYRKSLRLMKQAEKFGRPVICFVDTPGAFCGLEAEERGQGEAIARNLWEMSSLRVPILSVFIGEGGSGGALAMAVADEVWMLENSVYSILSPEGFASILWKDSSRAREAAEMMRLTAEDLKKRKIVERVFPEPELFDADHMDGVAEDLRREIIRFLEEYGHLDRDTLLKQRYERFRRM